MALTDYKIGAEDISANGVAAAPDKLTGTAAENKALFDRLIRNIVAEKMNGLIDAVVAELLGKMDAPEAIGVPGQYLRVGENGVEWGVPGGSGDMIAAVYDTDGDGSVNRADVAGRTEGNSVTATRLQTARSLKIQDESGSNVGADADFDGSADIVLRLPGRIKANIVGDVSGNVSGNVTGNSGSCSGNAATATKLQTARKLGDASFDGSSNITLADMGATKAANINVAAGTLAAFTARRIYIGTSTPASSSGAQGDLWIVI